MLLPSLETTRSDIHRSLQNHGFAVFYSLGRLMDKLPIIHWDWESHPSVEEFLNVAKQLDIKVIQMHENKLTPELIEETETQIEESGMPANDLREFSKRLKQCARHVGELCVIELSFDYRDRVYLYTVETDWYADLNDIVDVLLYSTPDDDDEPKSGGVSGYFSRN